MDSLTKRELSPHELGVLGAVHSFDPEKVTPLGDGWFNTIYRLAREDQPDLVLRVAPPPDVPVLRYEHQMMRRDIEFHRAAMSVDGGRVPALVDSDADGATIGRPYMLTELVPGETLEKVLPTLDPEEKRAMLEEVGEVVGTLHAHVGTGGFGWHGTAPSWSAGLMEMFESLLADRTDLNIELDAPNEQILGLVENAAQLFDEVDQPNLVHWDLGEPNILIDRQDGEYRVSGIIDWERALWGDPDCDLACFQGANSSFWTRYWRGAPEGRRAIRQQIYRLFFWTVMLVEEPLRFPGADHIPLIGAMWTNDWNGLSDLREGS